VLQGIRVPLGRPIAPFGDMPRDLPVLGVTLGGAQVRAFAAADARLGERLEPGPYLAIGDHTWVTGPLIRRFLEVCPPSGGQLVLDGPFLEFTRALQDLPDGRVPLWRVPEGPPDPQRLASLPMVKVDLAITEVGVPAGHPALAIAAGPPIPVTDAMAHTITHWTHLHRVNLLALIAFAEGERRRIEAGFWWEKGWALAKLLVRARSFRRARLEAAASLIGRGCRIHPTAVVEGVILGDEVEIGPFAVVRHSWIGRGSKIAEHARVVGSVVGERSTIAHGASVQLCVLLSKAWVSKGWGHQVSVFGSESFVAEGVTTYDLSFGGEVRVRQDGEAVASGTHFLGCAIGHRARVGPHVRIGYGEEVPNDAFLVADPAVLARAIPPDLGAVPTFVRDRAFKPIG
jgi:acetyltransferase-like isoleucine patch superfamily enzyme